MKYRIIINGKNAVIMPVLEVDDLHITVPSEKCIYVEDEEVANDLAAMLVGEGGVVAMYDIYTKTKIIKRIVLKEVKTMTLKSDSGCKINKED